MEELIDAKGIKGMCDGLEKAFKLTLIRFETYDKENKDNTSKEIVNILTKLTGTLSYISQTSNSLVKSGDYEARLAEIEKKIEKDMIKKHPEWGQ